MQRLSDVQFRRRRGFTLIELLVVIGIILILAAIGFAAVATFVTSGRAAATRALILKLDRVLQDRREEMERFIERADKRSGGYRHPEYMTYPADIDRYYGVNNGNGNFVNNRNPNLALYLARKRFFMQNFPQRYQDHDFNYDGNPDAPFNGTTSTPNDPTESAEMLYQFITSGAQFGSSPIGDFEASEIGDTDDDGFPEFIDAWGNPLRFYRWPTRLIRPQPAGQEGNPQVNVGPPGSPPDSIVNPEGNPGNINHEYILYLIGTLQIRTYLAVDPDDEYGLNVQDFPPAMPVVLTINPTAFEQGTGATDSPTSTRHAFHTKNTWHMPLIVSAGEDGQLGIFEPQDTGNNGHVAQPDMSNLEDMADNISSLQMRVGGN